MRSVGICRQAPSVHVWKHRPISEGVGRVQAVHSRPFHSFQLSVFVPCFIGKSFGCLVTFELAMYSVIETPFTFSVHFKRTKINYACL